jgi:hypothetical protein
MSNVEKLARSVDKEEKNWVEPIVNAHVLERISQVANTGDFTGTISRFFERIS